MKKLTSFAKKLWNDEAGQGATEYILMLVIVVAVAFLFKGKIMEIVGNKLTELAGQIGSFSAGGGSQ